jgi:hypothetical protein
MRQYNPLTEPDREFVERAIVEVLKVAQRQGITAANFLQMLDSGMRISDFLAAMDALQTPPTQANRDRFSAR